MIAVACAGAQSVLVVDDDGGAGVLTEIQHAVDAAASGDTILIKSGSYGGVSIASKSLRLVADQGGAATIRDGVSISDLAPGQSVGLHGLLLRSPREALVVSRCAGAVWVEDSTIQGPTAPVSTGDGVAVIDSPRVAVLRCRVTGGGAAAGSGTPAAAGLAASNSTVYVLDSTLAGGTGTPGQLLVPGGTGGAGLNVTSSKVHVQSSTVIGGTGGRGFTILFGCSGGGRGGDGILLSGRGSVVELLDTTPRGGGAGAGGVGCANGSSGSPTLVLEGQIVALAGTPPKLEANTPVRDDEVLTFTTTGTPGQSTWLLLGAAPSPAALPLGPLLIDAVGLQVVPLGPVPASGVLVRNVALPTLPAGVQVATAFAQGVTVDPALGVLAGSGQMLTVLSTTF
ncbi:MAG: hypothetical protein AAF628_30810 [Planctomycetota bacterium]